MKTIKLFLQYCFGFFLFLASLSMFFRGGMNTMGSIVVFLGSLVCIPVTREYIQKKLKIQFGRIFKYIFVLFSCFLIGIINPTGKSAETNYLKSEEENSDIQKKSFAETSLEIKKDSVVSPNVVTRNVSNIENKSISKNVNKEKKAVTHTNFAKKNNIVTVQSGKTSTTKKTKNVKKNSQNKSAYSSGRYYIRGPRGGCYYINSNGNKTYVGRSLCD